MTFTLVASGRSRCRSGWFEVRLVEAADWRINMATKLTDKKAIEVADSFLDAMNAPAVDMADLGRWLAAAGWVPGKSSLKTVAAAGE